MQHGVVQCVDPFEILCVEQVLCTNLVCALLAAKIGLEKLQHGIEDRKEWQAERSALFFERIGEVAVEQRIEHDAGRVIELIKDAVELLAGAHQRMNVLDRRHIDVLRGGRARDREQRLPGCVRDEMQMEEVSGPVRQSLKTCGRSGSRPRLQAPCKRSPPGVRQSVHIAAVGTLIISRTGYDLDNRFTHRADFQPPNKPMESH